MLYDCISQIEVNKIFDNRERKEEYLKRFFEEAKLQLTIPRTLTGINQKIIETWDYVISKRVIREMFFESEKYLYGRACKDKIDFANCNSNLK